jgi:hypothetical protein
MDEAPPERGLNRIVALANQANLSGSIDNNNRRKPQSTEFAPHSASGIKYQRYRDSDNVPVTENGPEVLTASIPTDW